MFDHLDNLPFFSIDTEDFADLARVHARARAHVVQSDDGCQGIRSATRSADSSPIAIGPTDRRRTFRAGRCVVARPDVAGLPLYQDTIYGLWRRVIFRICDMFDEAGREQCVYPIIMFRKNGDEWKVGNASRLAAYRYDDDGEPLELTKFMFHKMFRLPPSFIDLHPREGPSNIQPHPVNPQEIPPKKP